MGFFVGKVVAVPMKFVTKRIYNTWKPEPWRKAFDAYDKHREDLKGILPDSILELSDPSLLDDGLVIKVDHDRVKRKLVLTLRCGNLQIDYYDIVITYLGAKISPKHDRTLAKIARSTNFLQTYDNDIHFHEITVTKCGRITHRFLFNPGVQFAISCKSLTWKKVPRKGRSFLNVPDRYLGGPEVELSRPKRPLADQA
jgi:hypothetical protein